VIPEWDGGIEEPPPHVDGYDGPGDFHPDPYAGDDPRFTVTADNMDDYSEYLTQGTQALLETYPETYELKVYPSRRSAAMPDWVAENTRKMPRRRPWLPMVMALTVLMAASLPHSAQDQRRPCHAGHLESQDQLAGH